MKRAIIIIAMIEMTIHIAMFTGKTPSPHPYPYTLKETGTAIFITWAIFVLGMLFGSDKKGGVK